MATQPPISEVFKSPFQDYQPVEIKKLRSQLSMTQKQFGALFFAERGTVKSWESGRRKPSFSAIRVMQFVEIIAGNKHEDINHRIRKAYKVKYGKS